jgi:hypothetical protein
MLDSDQIDAFRAMEAPKASPPPATPAAAPAIPAPAEPQAAATGGWRFWRWSLPALRR